MGTRTPQQPSSQPISQADTSAGNNGSNQKEKERKKARRVSYAHDDIINKKIVYVHVDVEDGGPYCGLLQISVVVVNADFKVIDDFDRYIKPDENAVWNEEACRLSHGYTKDTPEIKNANSILEVWPEFVEFVEKHITGDKVGMMLAWSGKGSDCSKLFNVTEEHYKDKLFMPKGLKWFCDPAKCIGEYPSCELHDSKRKSKRKGYGLGLVYSEAFNNELSQNVLPDPSVLINAKAKRIHTIHLSMCMGRLRFLMILV